jgi:putative ABC transport system permease protein
VLRAAWKSLVARKLRLVLTALSIVLGVGFVAGTYVLTDTMDRSFEELFEQTAGGSDLEVRSAQAFGPSATAPGSGATEEREPVPDELLEAVQEVPGVDVAVGSVAGPATMVDPETGDAIGSVGPPTFGTNWTELAGRVFTIRQGRPPEGPGEVAIDAGTAEGNGLAVGERIPIIFESGREEFEIVGVLGFGESDNLLGATAAVFETETARRVLDREGVYDAISITVDEGADLDAVQAAVREELPGGVIVESTADVAARQSEELKEGLGFFQTFLLIFAAIALFVGSFIIFNTFSIIVAQRTRELALLRTLGASSRQIVWSVVLEAAVVGLIASVIGIVVGLGIALALQALLSAVGIDLPSTDTQLRLRTIVVSLVLGVGVAVVASIVPARNAARVAPIQALRETAEQIGSSRRRFILAWIVTVLGVGALAWGLFGSDSASDALAAIGLPDNAAVMVGIGAAVTLVGVAQLSPFIARPLAGGIGAPFRRRSVAAKIGRENAMRNPRRTASTASALMIGLGLVAMMAILAASLKASFFAVLDATVAADLTISSPSGALFSPDVATQVADAPGVGAVAAIRQAGFRVDGDDAFLTATDPASFSRLVDVGVSEGSLDELASDAIAVRSDVAVEKGWSLGDDVPAAFPSTGQRPLRLVAIFEQNTIAGDYLISIETYDDVYVEHLDSMVLVDGAEGVPSEQVREAVTAAAEPFPNVEVQDQTEFKEQQAAQFDVFLGIVTVLLLIAVVIALFGIINTLSLSIYERTRELGLLRAVGMGRQQMRRMVRYESVIISVYGAVLGIVIGIAFGWAILQAVSREFDTRFVLPGGQLLFYFIFATLVGVVAAIWPARRASKLNVLEAITYE